jgi:hypothetical protein
MGLRRWLRVRSILLLITTLQLLAAVFGVLIVATPTATDAASVPYQMNFQGRLTDNNGNIETDGWYNIKFRLYSVATGGSSLWEADRVDGSSHDYRVHVINGLFNIQLGDTTQGDPALQASWFDYATSPLYLEVELPTPGSVTCASANCAVWTEGPMTPRQVLAASPYAINADNLGGLSSSAFGQLSASNTFTGANTFTPTSGVGITVQAASSTASLDVKNSSGALEAYFDANGILNVAQTIQATTSTVDLGTSGSTFRTGYFGTSVQTPALNATSSGGTVTTNLGTLQRVASGTTTIDLKDTGNTTLSVENSGGGVAGISVDGGITIGTGQVYQVGASSGTSDTCTGSEVLGNLVSVGGIVTGGTCVAAGGGDQLIGEWTSTQATTATNTQTTVQFTGATNASPSFNNATHVLTLPSNASRIVVETKGGGGGGGGVGTANVIKGAGGGGEGGYSKVTISNGLASNYYFTVGADGAGGAILAAGNPGSPGSASCFGTNASTACTSPTVEAVGGLGGALSDSAVAAAGGAGGASASGVGDVVTSGAPGCDSTSVTAAAQSGCGGGQGGAIGVATTGAAGNNGTSGGGGSGALTAPASATDRAGGNGGNGFITITVYVTVAGTGSPATLQTAYDNSSTPDIVLSSSGLTVDDSSGGLGGNLLAVQNNAQTINYLAVTASGISTSGTATATGNINSTGGGIQTNGNTIITNGGALTNVTDFTQTSGTHAVTSANATSDATTITDTSFVQTAAGAASLLNGTYTDASTDTTGTVSNNGVVVNPTVNTTGAGLKNINGFSAAAPIVTACTSGACTLDGLRATTITSGALATVTSNGVDIQASTITAGTLNGVNISALAANANTAQTAINIGSNWNNVLTVNGTPVIYGSGQIAGGQIQSATVANGALTNSSITLTAGANIAALGSVALGGGLTIATSQAPTFTTSVTTPSVDDAAGLTLGLTAATLNIGKSGVTATFAGAISAGTNTITGNGSGLTNLNASDIVTGTGAVLIQAAASTNVSLTTTGTGTLNISAAAGMINTITAGSSDTYTNSAVMTQDQIDQTNTAAANAPALDGINLLQQTFFSKAATGNSDSSTQINITNSNTVAAGQVNGLRIVATGAGGTVNSNTAGLFIDPLANASTGTTSQNAIQVGANWNNVLSVNGTSVINGLGQVNGAQIQAATIANAALTSSSITLTAGSNIAALGSVSLGGTITIGTTQSPTFTTSVTTPALNSATATNLTLTSGTTGSVTLDSGTTGQVNIGTDTADAKTIQIGPAATNTSGTTINVGTNTVGAQDINVGSTGTGNADAGTIISIQGGTTATGSGAVIIGTNGAGGVTIDSGTTGAVDVGTGANAKTVTLGNTTSTTSLDLLGGSTTGSINIGSVASSVLSSTTNIATTNSATGTQKVTIGSNANTANSVVIDAGTASGTLDIGDSATAHVINIGAGGAGAGSAEAVNIGSPSTTTSSTVTVQGGNITTTNNGAGVIIGGGFNAGANLVGLTLDSTDTFAETANTCSATANDGTLYYNTTTSTIRGCVASNWEDIVTTSGLGLITYGVIPDSASAVNPGDLAASGTAGAAGSGPCRVYMGAATTEVDWTACDAYSGGRKIVIAAATNKVIPTFTNGDFLHLCLTGANGQPAFSATGAETADLPAFSANNPIVCLADIKTSAAAVTQIYDVRTFTTSVHTFANTATAMGLGWSVIETGINAAKPAASAAAQLNIGIVAASAGTTTGTPNLILSTGGPVWAKAAGTATAGDIVTDSATTAAYVQATGATSANLTGGDVYSLLGLSRTSTVVACTAATANSCQDSIFFNFNPE